MLLGSANPLGSKFINGECIVEQRSTLLVAMIAISSGVFFGQRPNLCITAILEDWALPNNTLADYEFTTNRVERCSTIQATQA